MSIDMSANCHTQVVSIITCSRCEIWRLTMTWRESLDRIGRANFSQERKIPFEYGLSHDESHPMNNISNCVDGIAVVIVRPINRDAIRNGFYRYDIDRIWDLCDNTCCICGIRSIRRSRSLCTLSSILWRSPETLWNLWPNNVYKNRTRRRIPDLICDERSHIYICIM